MKVHDLIEHFSGYVRVPIDPDEVADQICKYGIPDKISFVAVDLQERVLKSALHSYVLTSGVYGSPIIYSDIYFAKSLERCWQRMVCCKELLHTLDNTISQTARPEDAEKLISGLCNIADAKTDPLTPESLQVWHDRLMMYYAAAILFPKVVRDLFIPVYKAKLISIEQIASTLDLPETVVLLVLSDGWPGLYKALTGKN